MTFNYTKSLATVERLLAKFGQSVTFTRVTNGAYDPDTSTQALVETTYTASAVLLDYKGKDSGNLRDSMIEINDKKLLVSPVGLTETPNANDKVTIGGVVWNVINVKSLNPAGTVVLYECQVRIG